ncbi:U3 small nucleolar RNA-associated protein 8 [Lipomyces tetrasporus]|uniref:U3 small nucleolar RNA-associated protein 8 n=1 Tax=Lipomyces tetrasporus TaxID=54092 RepID=A0AAD7QTJ1_9ASCO|nr:U3 small nucleolar RNA-associated protein 8 [Lipomyces tetrasporus]KAJ8101028.1 U3 small nucleolar RNA-associated protein 8 [Lipomyces tetrasporus]
MRKMSSIAPPFTIYTLPSTAVRYFHISSPKPSVLDLAVTAAGISRITLRPTPRLIASVAISPLAEVLCPAVVVAQKGEGITAFVAIRERKRNIYLRRLEENGRVIETALDDEVVALNLLPDRIVVVVFNSGKIVAFKIGRDAHNKEQFEEVWSASFYDSGNSILYSQFSDIVENEVSLLVAGRPANNVLDMRKFKINSAGARMEDRWNLLDSDENDGYIQFHESGILFRLFDTSLEVITIPTLSRTTLDLAPFVSSVTSRSKAPPVLSYVPAGKSTILLSTGAHVLLINWQYKTILASLDLPDPDIFTFVRRVGKRAAVGTTKNGQIQVIAFNVGSGKLLECVTGKVKSITQDKDKPVSANIFFKEHYSARKYKAEAQAALAASQNLLESIIAQLRTLKNTGDVSGFDGRILPFLTGKSDWVEVEFGNQKSKNKSKIRTDDFDGHAKTVLSHKDKAIHYNSAAARQVDPLLISSIADLIFDTENDKVKLSGFRTQSLKYILSHPLFPTAKYPSLLTVLSSDSQLLMTALRYTHGVSVDALVEVLVSTLLSSEVGPVGIEIVNLIVARIEKDFSYHTIVDSLSASYPTTVLEKALESLKVLIAKPALDLNTFDIWNIIPCFIDASGILSLQQGVISSLSTLVDGEIQDLMGRMEVLEIVETALDWARRLEVRNSGSGIDGVVSSVRLMKSSRA